MRSAFQASTATGALVYLSLPPDGNDSNITQAGWYDNGGTSLSCPQSLVAIADQLNGGGLGLINPALYTLAANPAKYANDFFDIIQTGDESHVNKNQEDPSILGYPVTPGWDPVAGLGTPNAAALTAAAAAASSRGVREHVPTSRRASRKSPPKSRGAWRLCVNTCATLPRRSSARSGEVAVGLAGADL